MKLKIAEFTRKLAATLAKHLAPYRNLVFISLAAWVTHIIFRILLLFRCNAYGFPFVSKPDWFIFHAVCIDFLWICNSLLIFAIVAALIKAATKSDKVQKICTVTYAIYHSILFFVTLLDDEMQRFLGSHLSFGLVNTYKDTSSVIMFWDYMENDFSIPFLQLFLVVLVLPFTYGVYRLLRSKVSVEGKPIRKTVIAMTVFYIASYAFINFIWTGNARMTKLRPVVGLVYSEIFDSKKQYSNLDEKNLDVFKKFYHNLWTEVEGDSLWFFPQKDKDILYREPSAALLNDSLLKARRAEKPNFILVFMETHRGLNTGFLNPGEKSPTPFLDSLAASSRIWERMHTSGLPTTGGVLTTHIGIPHHSTLSQATDLAHINLPSFASVLTDSGYVSHYFSAADPAWDNLGVWMSKWYTAQHYDRSREDDSSFVDNAISYVADTLAKEGKPFLATLMTRSNHYPFNFAAGMTEEEKNSPLTERIKVTMNYADRQLARFIQAMEKQDWYENTYVIVMADHGFPLGENGVSTMNGGAFSNATWIPFIIHGKGIEAARDTVTTAQIDIAPTILELAGIAVPNIFMGHNLMRGHGTGLSLGAYSRIAAIGYDGYRLIQKSPLGKGEVTGLFAEADTHQKQNFAENLSGNLSKEKEHLESLLDTLIKISDYSLERGF